MKLFRSNKPVSTTLQFLCSYLSYFLGPKVAMVISLAHCWLVLCYVHHQIFLHFCWSVVRIQRAKQINALRLLDPECHIAPYRETNSRIHGCNQRTCLAIDALSSDCEHFYPLYDCLCQHLEANGSTCTWQHPYRGGSRRLQPLRLQQSDFPN